MSRFLEFLKNCKHEEVYRKISIESKYIFRRGWHLRYNVVERWYCCKCGEFISRTVIFRYLHPYDYKLTHLDEYIQNYYEDCEK